MVNRSVEIPSRFRGDRKKTELWLRLQTQRKDIRASTPEASQGGVLVKRRDSGEVLMLKLTPQRLQPPTYSVRAEPQLLPLKFAHPVAIERKIRIPLGSGESVFMEPSQPLPSAGKDPKDPATFVRILNLEESRLAENTGGWVDYREFLDGQARAFLDGRQVEGVMAGTPESADFHTPGFMGSLKERVAQQPQYETSRDKK